VSTASNGVWPDGTPIRHVVLPLPIVDWKAVVLAYNPTREPTRGRLRELRKKYLLAAGFTVFRRGEHGLEGRSTYYSVLSALAGRIRQEGRDEEGNELEQAATRLVEQFSVPLEEFLSHHSLKQLPQADFFYDLTAATAQRLAEHSRPPRSLLAAARVDEVVDDVAHLEGTSPRGGPVTVDLPRALLDRQSVMPGDLVWVFSRVVGDAALVELLPAVRAPMRVDVLWHAGAWPEILIDEWTRDHHIGIGSDGLTDEERAQHAAQFNATVGANLTAEELARMREKIAEGRIARRRLHPAG
jgi:hypothetical protein